MIDSLLEMFYKIMLCFSDVCRLDSYIPLTLTSHYHLLQSSDLRHVIYVQSPTLI